MRCDLFILATGVAADSCGALTLVGVNQRVISADSLPFQVRQKAVMSLTDENSSDDGTEFSTLQDGELVIRVLDPSGTVQFTATHCFTTPKEKTQASLPGMVNVIADILISGTSYGTYDVEVCFRSVDHREMSKRFPIYVIPRQADAPVQERDPSAP